MTSNKFCVVLTTTNSEESANNLARKVLTEKLAACVQISKIQSHYVWKGDVCNDPELLLYFKTKSSLYEKLEACIIANHTYEVPEIIMLPLTGGSLGYMKWIEENTCD